MNPLLARERTRQSFDVDQMITILDGSKKNTFKRRWIWDGHGSDYEAGVHSDYERGELVGEAIEHFMDVHAKHFERDYRPKGNEMASMSDASMITGPLSLHYGVFMSTLRTQCSEEQKEWWLGRAMRLGFIGCYAQTELAHGSNVRGIQTTATYSVEHQGWIIDTPSIAATKWWGTGMYSATHAALYAQCFTPDGVNHGLHVFLVQLRGPDLMPLPGIEMGECGTKIGDNDKTTGWVRFSKVVIPREHMMAKKAHVEPDGTYVLHHKKKKKEKKEEGKKEEGKKEQEEAKPASAAASAAGGASNDKLQYLSMMKTRIALTSTAAGALARASTIAVRYSCVREQGFVDTRPGQSHLSPEMQIVDYANQQYRLTKWLSTAYATKFVARWLLSLKRSVESGETSADELPALHASSSGLKGLCCKITADGIEDLRRACGGHGYLLNSGIAALEGDYKYNATAEGDSVVLLLQTARYLLKARDAARAGQPVTGIVAGLAPLADPSFDPLADGRPAAAAQEEGEGDDGEEGGATAKTFSEDLDYLGRLLQYRVLVATAKAGALMDRALAEGLTVDQARNKAGLMLMSTATSHIYYFMFQTFAGEARRVADPACRQVLCRLCALFGCAEVRDGQQWHGLLRPGEIDRVEEAIGDLLAALRPELVALTDAFDYPDQLLGSTLGRKDGNYMEALLEHARESTKTWHEPGRPPRFFGRATKYLDLDFLALRNTKIAGDRPPQAKL